MADPSTSDGGTAPVAPPTVHDIWHAHGTMNIAKRYSPQHTVDEWQHIARTNAFGDQTLTPADGFTAANRTLMCQLYTYYGSLHQKLPDKFVWAGLAKMAGACVISGLDSAAITLPFSSRADDRASVQGVTIAHDLFEDIAWQHEAYAGVGITELRALLPDYDVANKTPNIQQHPSLPAWELIDKGNAVQAIGIADREQMVFVQNGFNDIPRDFFTNRASAVTQCPHPYGRSFLVVEKTLNILDKDPRWDWIATDMWPTWTQLPPEERGRLVALTLDMMMARNFAPVLPAYLPPGDGGEDDD